MVPSPGRIVHYRLSEPDVAQIAAQRRAASPGGHGNPVKAGDVLPMIITKVLAEPHQLSDATPVQGQVFLDGPDVLWVTSRRQGGAEGQFSEPGRVY